MSNCTKESLLNQRIADSFCIQLSLGFNFSIICLLEVGRNDFGKAGSDAGFSSLVGFGCENGLRKPCIFELDFFVSDQIV